MSDKQLNKFDSAADDYSTLYTITVAKNRYFSFSKCSEISPFRFL